MIANVLEPNGQLPETQASSAETKGKYTRTWSLELVSAVYQRTKDYCEAHKKILEMLTVDDYWSIAQEFNLTASQCMLRMREANISGTLKSGVWCKAEDELLTTLIQDGLGWREIVNHLNATIHAGYKVRNTKHCKERWNNHLNPQINRGPWTAQEDLFLLQLFEAKRNQWTAIALRLGNRTATAVKNRVKSLLKRVKEEPPARAVQAAAQLVKAELLSASLLKQMGH